MVEGGTLLRCYTSLTGYRGFESLLLRSESATFAGKTRNPRSGSGFLPALTTPTGTPTRPETPAPKAFSGQRGLHSGGRLVSHAGQDVGVSVEGKGHGGVPQEILDELGMVAPGEQQRGARVPEVVEAYIR